MLVLLPLVFALQSVSIGVGGKKAAPADSAVRTADSVARIVDREARYRDRRHNRRVRRLPVTPELERSAFRDTDARTLLLRARHARLTQDSTLLAYDASAYQRLSVGLGFRATGRDRLLMRSENASRVRWSRAGGVHIDLKGRRTVLPMMKEGEGDAELDEMSPIPYFPGREALWIGSGGMARAEVNEGELVHPIALGSEAYYRYASGDSVKLTLSDGRQIRLQELRIEPRRPEWKLSVGSFWFDVETAQLVRAVYRFSAPMDIWKVAEEEDHGESDEDIPFVAKAMISPMLANLEAVTIEYGLFGGRFWLPRTQTAEGWAKVSFIRVPFKIEERFKYESVNGTDSLPPVPPQQQSVSDSLFGDDSTRWRDLPVEERRERSRRIAVGRLARRGDAMARREAECKATGSYGETRSRYEDAVRVLVRIPCDTSVLAKSPELPASIYESGEELFGGAERDELLKALDFSLQSGWAPQSPVLSYGIPFTRYNRVEGFSTGFGLNQQLGKGFSADFSARLGLADLEPNAELGVTRSNGRNNWRVAGYRRLAAANDWGTPLGFGASLNGLIFGRDEGFYYRTAGVELERTSARGGGFTYRLFAEHHSDARREASFSFSRSLGSATAFLDNIDATNGTVFGGAARDTRSFGLDPSSWRLFSDIRAEAAAGDFGYQRIAGDVTVSRALVGPLAFALTAGAGTMSGEIPEQRKFYLGGAQTVRGQIAGASVGDTYWLTRLELGGTVAAFRPVVFGDLGWAGKRAEFSNPGRPLSGVGVGTSILDGLIRFDVSRGIYKREKLRLDFYLEGKF